MPTVNTCEIVWLGAMTGGELKCRLSLTELGGYDPSSALLHTNFLTNRWPVGTNSYHSKYHAPLPDFCHFLLLRGPAIFLNLLATTIKLLNCYLLTPTFWSQLPLDPTLHWHLPLPLPTNETCKCPIISRKILVPIISGHISFTLNKRLFTYISVSCVID